MPGGQSSCDVNYDAQGIFSRHAAHSEKRIVSRDGAPADNNGVAQRAQTVEMDEAFWPRDIMRRAAVRRDIAIETLPKLGHDKRRARRRGDRKIEGGEIGEVRRNCGHRGTARVRAQRVP